MPTSDLRDWIALLEREGELVRVGAEVDPHLEVTEIVTRTIRVRRPGALVREPEGEQPRPARQPVRHRAAHVSRARGRAARRRCDDACRRARDAAAAGPRREDPRAQAVEVDRRLATAHRAQGSLPGDRPRRRRRRSGPSARANMLARRRRAVHHAAGRDHARSARRQAQRRHVPHAGAGAARDRDALAAPQGWPRRLSRDGRSHGGRRRARARSGDGIRSERAASEAHRRADVRGPSARRARRRRQRRHASTSKSRRLPRSFSRATSSRASSSTKGRSATTPASTRRPSRSRSSTSRR